MSNDFNFGARLKALRLSLNLTQSGFARKIGVPQATISAYELSKISPSAEVIEKISKTFGVTIDWLFGRDNNLSITSMGDIWSFLLILFTSKNISIETTLHTDVESESPDSADDDKRNWVNLRIYKDNPEATDNALLYEMVSKAYYMSKELRDYMRSQALFEYEARHFKSEYDKIPLKQIDHSNISDAEQHKLLVQALKKQFLDSDSDE